MDNEKNLTVLREIRSVSRASRRVLGINNLMDKVQVLFGQPGGPYDTGIFVNRDELLAALGVGPGKKVGIEEVRKGDLIRVHTKSGGTSTTVEGVAHYRGSSGGWSTEDWGALIYNDKDDQRIYLLERPAPQLPTEPGSVIIATKVRGAVGEWVALYDAGGNYWTTQGVAGGATVHVADQITEWRPAKVVEPEHG